MLTLRVICAASLGLMSVAGCVFKGDKTVLSGSGGGFGAGSTGGSFGGGTGAGGFISAPCAGLECQQTTCSNGACTVAACTGGARTTVSGIAYDPAGKVPLYNVTVYVPTTDLAPLPEGASCLPCDTATSGKPLVRTTSDDKGAFSLDNVPAGNDIPLVVQIGKWRRRTLISTVMPCVDNPLTDPDVTRLPRNQAEGHIPKIALTTGAADALECLLRKIGVADSEFTPETGPGRVNLFAGGNAPPDTTGVGAVSYQPQLNGGAAFTRAEGWWDDVNNLNPYDMLLHSCEGVPASINKSEAAVTAFRDYADRGGRAFASHWHNWWIEHGAAPFPTVAQFDHLGIDTTTMTFTIDQTFPKGIALAAWLMNVGASMTLGQLEILGAKHTVDSVNDGTQAWIRGSTVLTDRNGRATTSPSVQYFSFNTPVGVPTDRQCGKVVFSDLHVSSGSGAATDDVSRADLPFPSGCMTKALSPQEKTLEFMLFDLSACTAPGIP